jgi:long-chain acyl-CoA synthetase
MSETGSAPSGPRAATGASVVGAGVGVGVASAGGWIPAETARTLPGLFARRVAESPDGFAYRQFEEGGWRDYRWGEMARLVGRWRRALEREGLSPGDRVALSLSNGVDWVAFDQAALGLGLVVVPLYTTDSPGNAAHILGDSGARLLLLADAGQWVALAPHAARFPDLLRVLCRAAPGAASAEGLVQPLADWLGNDADLADQPNLAPVVDDPDGLATLVYTSGTTGSPKGVMLSHRNILSNAEAILERIPARTSDVFLSFLPLAHAFERTVGYYLPMMAGSSVAYARSIEQLREDLVTVRPTVLLSVPRVYDKIYLAIQTKLGEAGIKRALFDTAVGLGWRRFEAARGRAPPPSLMDRVLWPPLRRLVASPVLERLGGRLRVAVSGGAPLSATVARFFVGLGLPLTEGYGLTEAAPVVTNTAPEDFLPGRVGVPLPRVEVRLGPQDEIYVRGPNVCLGYWGDVEATAQAIGAEGWLHTGDIGALDNGYVQIRGRLKEILVTSTGQKVPPTDMEMALTMEPLFDQAMVVGEGRPYLAALLVLAPDHWRRLAEELGLDPDDPRALADPRAVAAAQTRVDDRLKDFPGYAQVRALHLSLMPWTIENGLITPTMKLKRPELEQRFGDLIEALYARPRRPSATGPGSVPRPR